MVAILLRRLFPGTSGSGHVVQHACARPMRAFSSRLLGIYEDSNPRFCPDVQKLQNKMSAKVIQLLKTLGLDQYIPVFRSFGSCACAFYLACLIPFIATCLATSNISLSKNEITIETLLACDKGDFRELIPALGPRRVLMDAVVELRRRGLDFIGCV